MKSAIKNRPLSESRATRRKVEELERVMRLYVEQGLPMRIALSQHPQKGEAEAFFSLLEWAKNRGDSEIVWESNPRDARQAYVLRPKTSDMTRGAEQVQSLLGALGRGY